ncbi:cobalamin biosynthesis bifunctional protein CbiET [Thiocapsa imhoffii]|uniref:Cobalamin biosynthesis bifunctional protein CbiET n=1 Tax=Thiocapsa imhoffii TaxID=382777 RepID=A0A9X0WJB1_9GAMM|nr:cobalamin biosynthesis bifunctional protein CbiET [Thiocapsa imhoffii]
MTEPEREREEDQARCWVIGVLDDGPQGLSDAARERLGRVQRVIGATRVLALCDGLLNPHAERLDLTGRTASVAAWVSEALDAEHDVAVLATGDPLCFGIGGLLAARLMPRLPPSRFRVLPNPSTLQLACARFMLPWQDARWVSVHHCDSGDWVCGGTPEHGLYHLAQALTGASGAGDLIGVLTSPANGPERIARLLLAEGLDDVFAIHVAECLLRPDERLISEVPAAVLASARCAHPNVVLLQRRHAAPARSVFGLPDAFFAQRVPARGLITKREVRAVALALLELRPGDLVWDLGAGSGSLGLEAARLCPDGHVHAIERNHLDLDLIETNRRRLGVTNYSATVGVAPGDCATWPAPDTVFIGGSGGQLTPILEMVVQRLRPAGRLVVSLVLLENLTTAMALLDRVGLDWSVTQIQAARSSPLAGGHRLQPENPVWLIQARTAQDPPLPDGSRICV